MEVAFPGFRVGAVNTIPELVVMDAVAEMADQNIYMDEATNLRTNSFTRAGYRLAGWNTSPDGTGAQYAPSASVTNMRTTNHDTVKLYAQWSLAPGDDLVDGATYMIKSSINGDYSMINYPNIFFAGQITGVEGYMESAGSGIICGINAVRTLCGQERLILPEYTMLGALQRHISNRDTKDFQPMGANFGILPPIEPKIRDKRERYAALSDRALAFFDRMQH